MSSRREYEIAFVGLKPGIHEYHYEVDDKFFSAYTTDFTNCKAQIKLTHEKIHHFHLCYCGDCHGIQVSAKADIVSHRRFDNT